VGHQGGVARVRNQLRQLRRDPQLPLHHAKQQDAAIGGDAPAIKGGNQLLAADGWKTKRYGRIVGHGGCGSMRLLRQDGFETQSLNALSVLRDTRQQIPAMP
jgi:carbonic anhydrase